MIQQKKLVTILIIGFGVLLLIVGALYLARGGFDTSSTMITDRDTGEQYDPEAPITNTGGNDPSYGTTHNFGLVAFSEAAFKGGESVGYTDSVKAALWKYGDDRLEKAFKTLTLIPSSVETRGGVITGDLRLGQTDELVVVEVALSRDKRNAIVTINKDGAARGGTFVYVGGIDNKTNYTFRIDQKNDTSSDLVISAYEGYRSQALDYLSSLGYNVPDISITYKNYENPFL